MGVSLTIDVYCQRRDTHSFCEVGMNNIKDISFINAEEMSDGEKCIERSERINLSTYDKS